MLPQELYKNINTNNHVYGTDHLCYLVLSCSMKSHLFISWYTGSTKKPEDMYRIIEHFALGRRRLELFGEDHNIRPGWLTLGKGLSSSNFHKEVQGRSYNSLNPNYLSISSTCSEP